MSNRSGRVVCFALIALAGFVSGCGDAGEGPQSQEDGETAGVSISLMGVQSDADCFRATFTSTSNGPTVSLIFAAPTGATPALLKGLPEGNFSLSVEAFDIACASLVPTTPQTWISDPVDVFLDKGRLETATVVLQRPASSSVTLDFDTSQSVSLEPVGIVALAVSEPYLYVGRTSGVARMHVAGSDVEYLASVASPLRELAVDAGTIYYVQAGTPAGVFGVAPGLEKLSYKPGGQFVAPAVGGVFVSTFSGASTQVEKVVRSGFVVAVTPVGLTAGNSRITTDASSVYTWNQEHFINKLPQAGGSPTTIYQEASALAEIEHVASDGTNVYFTQSLPGGASGIYRVPVAGGAASLVANVPAGRPLRLALDGSNVFYLVRSVDGSGTCLSSSINRVAKTGGTVTPVWSMNKQCPSTIAVASTGVFFDAAGGDLRRSPK